MNFTLVCLWSLLHIKQIGALIRFRSAELKPTTTGRLVSCPVMEHFPPVPFPGALFLLDACSASLKRSSPLCCNCVAWTEKKGGVGERYMKYTTRACVFCVVIAPSTCTGTAVTSPNSWPPFGATIRSYRSLYCRSGLAFFGIQTTSWWNCGTACEAWEVVLPV